MPDNSHLTWVEIKDFSKGFWNGQDFLMPADAFQKMEDCYPRVNGGLRAFFKADTTSIATTGIVDTTNERIEGVYPLVGPTGIAYFMLTSNASTGLQKWYWRAVGASSWTNIKSFSTPSSYANRPSTSVITYHDNTNGRTDWAIMTTHNKSDSSEDGFYLVRPDTGAVTFVQQSPFYVTPIVQYQARAVFASLSTLVWTDPGAVASPPAANFLTIQSGNNDVRDIIAALIVYAPDTLLVGTVGSGWWTVSGDITDPVVRQMGDEFNPWIAQKIARAQDGAIFFEAGTGVFQTNNMAANFTRLDPQLLPHAATIDQGFGVMGGYLFAPQGRVYSFATKSWFTLSDATTNGNIFNWVEQPSPGVNGLVFAKGVMGAQYKANGAIAQYNVDEVNGTRVSTYTIKSAPLRDEKGHQIRVREVQVSVDSFNAAAQVAVTVNGTTQTASNIGAGKNTIVFLFNEVGEYLDVTVTPNSTTSAEVPIIETMRIAVRPDSHRLR